jgi:hypothetical protein
VRERRHIGVCVIGGLCDYVLAMARATKGSSRHVDVVHISIQRGKIFYIFSYIGVRGGRTAVTGWL